MAHLASGTRKGGYASALVIDKELQIPQLATALGIPANTETRTRRENQRMRFATSGWLADWAFRVPLEDLFGALLALEDVRKVDVLVRDRIILGSFITQRVRQAPRPPPLGRARARARPGGDNENRNVAKGDGERTSSGSSLRPRMTASRGAFFHDPSSA